MSGLLVYSVGHSTRPSRELVRLLRAHGVERVVDVRTVPRSRHNPQFDRVVWSRTLHAARLRYRHLPELGGLRRPRPDSVNGAWRNASFRGFADHMQTPSFARGLATLLRLARAERVAVMCAEAVPWRCHRSLIADALLVRGAEVREIESASRFRVHALTPWACVRGTTVTYPAPVGPRRSRELSPPRVGSPGSRGRKRGRPGPRSRSR